MRQIRAFNSSKLLASIFSILLLFVTIVNIASIHLTLSLNFKHIVSNYNNGPISHLIGCDQVPKTLSKLRWEMKLVGCQSTYTDLISEIVISVGPMTLPLLQLADNSLKLYEIRQNRLIMLHSDMKPNGLWSPKHCNPLHRVAVIIPFKNRTPHLVTLLSVLIPVLKRQEVMFQIFVTEQVMI